MKKTLTLKIAIASIMAALSIVLERFSIPLLDGQFKITLYGLPLLFSGIMFGPIVGVLSGVVVGFVAQALSQWGLSVTSPLWMLAPIIWGGVSGGIAYIFKKKNNKFTLFSIIVIVVATSLLVSTVNTIVTYLDGVILGYVVEQTIVKIIGRFGISLGLCIPYTIILYFICNRLKHLSWNNEINDEENK